MPDTGAEISLAPPSLLDELNTDVSKLLPEDENLDIVGPSGETMESLGILKVKISVPGYTTTEDIHIVPNVGRRVT